MGQDELASALRINVRTLQRNFARGMPQPSPGEAIEQWIDRARAWRAEHGRRRAEPVDAGDTNTKAFQDFRYRKLKADELELQLAKQRGELHSKAECEAEQVLRCQEIAAAFANLGDACARRGHLLPPEQLKVVIDEEVRRRLLILSSPAEAGA